ncbi:hypothetical protein [Shewanella maritima]|uniref:hypothetical protein n=1 Tax=Shewanella maritima TaxID=2520507 RepID=UPI003736324C
MSSINHVLSAAKAIADKGHTPNIALLKGKLGKQVPMPTLIQGLRQFKAMSDQEIQSINAYVEPAQKNTQPVQPNIEQLMQQVSEMQSQIKQLESRISQLESLQDTK